MNEIRANPVPKKKFVLVTGGAGFVGSHTAKELYYQGFTPVILDNFSNGTASQCLWGVVRGADLLNRAEIKAVLDEFEFCGAFHFAGLIEVGASVERPADFFSTNVLGSYHLLAEIEAHGNFPLVFSSTCSVYGTPRSTPIDESFPLNPENPYAESKRAVEVMLREYARKSNQRFVALRYFNASGSDPDGIIGEMHNPETHLIPRVLDVALGKAPQLVINGGDYQTPDGTCIRDYVHVSDLARAHVLALAHLLDGGKSDVFNLGSERGNSVLEVIECCRQVTREKIPVTIGPRRPGDVAALVADSSKAKSVLGWKPVWTELFDHVKHAWEFRKKLYQRTPVTSEPPELEGNL